MTEHFIGRISRLYCAPKPNNWFSGKLKIAPNYEIRIAGIANVKVKTGTMVELDAVEVVSPQYGTQYQPVKGTLITRVLSGEKEVVEFLASSLFPGIGPKTAQKIYDTYGECTIEKLDKELDLVAATCSLSKSQKDTLEQGIRASVATAALIKTYPHMKVKTADRILDARKDLKVSDINKAVWDYGPYRAFRAFGVSTVETDEIAIEDCNVSETDDRRFEMVLLAALQKYCGDRHATFVLLSDPVQWHMFFYDYFMKVTLYKQLPYATNGVQFTEHELAKWIHNILGTKEMKFTVVERTMPNGTIEYALYNMQMREAELKIARYVADGSLRVQPNRFVSKFRANIRNMPNVNMVYSQEQITAVKNVFKHEMSFISGGPGRGKTHTLSLLIELWRKCVGENILLLAPTGKAVNKMKAQTDYRRAETIARFVVTNKYEADLMGEMIIGINSSKIPVESDTLIIIDEVSMLDFVTAADLLDYIKGCTVVFVGDKDQLSPIEPGPFFAECLASGNVVISNLTKNFRTESAEINDNADAIMAKLGVELKDLKITPNFQIIPSLEYPQGNAQQSQAEQYIVAMYKQYMQNGADFNDIMLIAPFAKAKYRLSSTSLNTILQDELNPEQKMFFKLGADDLGKYYDTRGTVTGVFDSTGVIIRVGDRVMNTKNNMNLGFRTFKNDDVGNLKVETTPDDNMGIFNGDTGVVVRVYPPMGEREALMFCIELDDTRSEAERIAMPLPKKYVWVTAKFDSRNHAHLDNWCLAYALSVHKAQGSEAKHVILALSGAGYGASKYMIQRGVMPFLTKNMLYTAITRAKNTVTIVCNKEALVASMKTPYLYTNTRLAYYINEETKKLKKGAVI